MYWIVDDYLNKIDTGDNSKYIFYQIFPEYNKITIKDNVIYNFGGESKMVKKIIDKNSENKIKILVDIKIKDSVIQYSYIVRNKTYTHTFLFYEDFTSENEEKNYFKFPNIKYNYTKTENSKMPNLLSKEYDYNYCNIELEIYQNSENTLLIVQKSGDNIKRFLVSRDLREIKHLI